MLNRFFEDYVKEYYDDGKFCESARIVKSKGDGKNDPDGDFEGLTISNPVVAGAGYYYSGYSVIDSNGSVNTLGFNENGYYATYANHIRPVIELKKGVTTSHVPIRLNNGKIGWPLK